MKTKTFALRVYDSVGGESGAGPASVTLDSARAARYLEMCAEAKRLSDKFGEGTSAYVKVYDPQATWYEGDLPDEELQETVWNDGYVEVSPDKLTDLPQADVDGVYVFACADSLFWSGWWGDTKLETEAVMISQLVELAK